MKIRHPSWFPKLVGACDREIHVFVKIPKKQKFALRRFPGSDLVIVPRVSYFNIS